MADIVIQFPEVTGSSKVAKHEGWIDLQSFQQGITSPADPTSSSGSSAGKSSLTEFVFTAEEGIHCVNIIKNGMSGKHFPKVVCEYLKRTGDAVAEVYKRCTMEQVYITSYSSSRPEGSVGYEGWSMAAAKAKWEFLKQNEQGGLEAIGDVTLDASSGEVS